MIIFWTSLCMIILLLVYLITKKWRVTIAYKNKKFSVKIGFFYLYSPKRKRKDEKYIKIPKLSFSELRSKAESVMAVCKLEKNEIASLLKEISRVPEIKTFNLAVTFGFGDAAVTGIANGMVWGIITFIVSFVRKYIDIEKKTNLAVYPDYTNACFEVDFLFSFDIRLYKFFEIRKKADILYKRIREKLK